MPELAWPADLSRSDAEDFLYAEAAFLDDWQLQDWADLFTEDSRYVIPSTDVGEEDVTGKLAIVNDDHHRLRGRVTRLLSDWAHIENPPSRTCRLVTNVRLVGVHDDGVEVCANFQAHRSRRTGDDVYVGRSTYRLRRTPDGWRITHKRAALVYHSLAACGGVVSIIL